MRAMRVSELGDIDQLRLEETTVPKPGPGQVRITMEAAGVNFPDILMISGHYQMRPELPFSPGAEVAGVVSGVGDGTTLFAAGDRVVGTPYFGAFAEEVLVPEAACESIPDDLASTDAAVLPLAFGTALYALRNRGRLQPGDSLLVTGATGGVGSAAVKLGKLMDAYVIAAVGNPEKADVARSMGADDVVTYGSDASLRDAMKALHPRGADVILDNVGGDVMGEALRCVAWEGRILVVGFTSGAIPQLPANLLLLKGSSVVGVFYGRWREHDPEASSAQFAELAQWVIDGELDPGVSKTYPLADAVSALQAIQDRSARGKLVIVP